MRSIKLRFTFSFVADTRKVKCVWLRTLKRALLLTPETKVVRDLLEQKEENKSPCRSMVKSCHQKLGWENLLENLPYSSSNSSSTRES